MDLDSTSQKICLCIKIDAVILDIMLYQILQFLKQTGKNSACNGINEVRERKSDYGIVLLWNGMI